MANVEFIQKRIAGKEKEIAKLEGKLARIEKAASTNWEVNPYYYSESDRKWTLKDLESAKKALEDYKAKLIVEEQKANSRNVPAIIEFLDGWKARMTEFYVGGINEYFEASNKVREMFKNAGWYSKEYEEACKASDELRERVHGKFETVVKTDWRGRQYKTKVKVEDGDLEPFARYLSFTKKEEAIERLEKDLTDEYNRKYDFIIERTNAIVGTITDASNLKVGYSGDLNGFIIGTDATAKVQTIGAGGYNIQCFHFRTLIHKA